MNSIAPLETQHLGIRFRSRLEARWAHTFHLAGIKFQYEPEGYGLPSGNYLPDFYLPELNVEDRAGNDTWFEGTYVEVKPLFSLLDLRRLRDFALFVGPVLVLAGESPSLAFTRNTSFFLKRQENSEEIYNRKGWCDLREHHLYAQRPAKTSVGHFGYRCSALSPQEHLACFQAPFDGSASSHLDCCQDFVWPVEYGEKFTGPGGDEPAHLAGYGFELRRWIGDEVRTEWSAPKAGKRSVFEHALEAEKLRFSSPGQRK